MNTTFLKTKLILFSLIIQLDISAQSHKLLISEFMAINDNSIADEDGDHPDWIEIYNPDDSPINLKNWYLTDKADNLTKWDFPDISLGSNSYMIIFASEKNRDEPGSNLHTNFKLSGSGEFLALVEPDGTTISYSFGSGYPAQRADVSYGLYQGQHIYFDQPTPGSENILTNQVLTPLFSVGRGFFEQPFDVTLNTTDNSLSIYYTTDGSRPSKNNGILYTSPIPITTTTPLSAVAVNDNNTSSEVISHSYFFIKDIVQQPNNPDGYPSKWGTFLYSSGNAPADYEIDPEVCNDPEFKELMDNALLAIPTLSIVTDIKYLFSHEKDAVNGGIYIYTGDTGDGKIGAEWERPVSVEYFDPNSNKEFQINCGLRLHGGNSRKPDNSQKHSFRISFRSIYGPSKLNYRFFDETSATNEFNSLVLRAGYNYSWIKNSPTQRENAQYLQDPFAKNTQLDMGHLSAHERFVHLYLNGLYWGVYNVSEKITNDFMESYLGGNEDDYDVIKDHGGTVDGNFNAWTKLYNQTQAGFATNAAYQKVQGKNPDGTINPSYDNLLDVDNLIDYMIYNMYIGNIDWDHNNWLMARNRVTNDAGFKYFCWDAETSMLDVNENIVDEYNEGNPSWIYQKLRENTDFKMRFADHIQKHFFNGDALTYENCLNRYLELAEEIDMPIIAESARWGDYRKDVHPSDNVRKLYIRNDWLAKKQDLLDNYFPYRSKIVVEQFRDYGMFPNIDAPVFSHYGGELDPSIDLSMTADSGDIYYTTDGSDPRESVTANISSLASMYLNPLLINESTTVKARAKWGDEWSALTEATFDDIYSTNVENQIVKAAIETGNFPNPFNLSTTIFYTLPNDGKIEVNILSIDGRIITNLYKGYQWSGYHTQQWIPQINQNGIFIYQIQYNNQSFYGKIIRSRY